MSRPHLVAAALLAVFLTQLFTASAIKSVTSDEPPHIAAGLSYLATGTIRMNQEHPPLLKELAALFLLPAGIYWPDTPASRILLNSDDLSAQWTAGNAVIVENGIDRVMFWARLPIILIATGLGCILYLWGTQLFSPYAGLGALFLYVLDPNILAHSYLVTTDTGFAAFTLLFFFSLWNYLQKPNRIRLICTGLALGACLGTKYSAAVIPAIAAVLMLAARRPLRQTASSFAVILAIAAAVLTVLYLGNPFFYFTGYSKIYGDRGAGYQHFLAGGFANHFYSYLAAAWFLKEPLPQIILSITGLILLLRNQSLQSQTKLFLLLPPTVLFLLHSVKAANIGFRYMLPVLPFCYLLAGAALAWLFSKQRILAVLLGIWAIVAAAGIYPDHLSYFNETACLLTNPRDVGLDGGTRCGTAWLDDSNVDWGQGMKQLKSTLDRAFPGIPVRLAWFTGLPPEYYGIQYQPVDFNRDLMPSRGIYVISAHFLARLRAQLGPNPQVGAWLLAPPDAIIGHSHYVYLIP